jgi:flagellar protein FlaG
VIQVNVTNLATDVGYKGKGPPEIARSLSAENKGATESPVTVTKSVPYDKDRLKEATKIAEKLSRMSNRKLKFEYREEADMFQITVVNEDDEVIRKIPADRVLSVIENIERMLGLRIDTKA